MPFTAASPVILRCALLRASKDERPRCCASRAVYPSRLAALRLAPQDDGSDTVTSATDSIMAKIAKQNSLASVSGHVVLVGAGKMGGALLEGWLARKLNPKKVVVIDPQPSKQIKALAKRGVKINPKGAIAPAAAMVVAASVATGPSAVRKALPHP